MMRTILGLAIAASALAGSSPAGAGGEPVPWTVRLDVAYGPAGGPSEFLRALESRALAAAAVAACVARVTVDGDEPAEAVWRVRVLGLEEETLYDDTVYGRHAADREPGRDLLLTAEVRFDLESSVEAPGRTSERVKRLRIRESVRPLGPGERPEEEARERALRRAAGDLARVFCKALRKARREAGASR